MTDNLLFAKGEAVNLDAAFLFVRDSGNVEIYFPGAVIMNIPGIWDRIKSFASERDHVIPAGDEIFINIQEFISVRKNDLINPIERGAPAGIRIQFRTADKDSAVRFTGEPAVRIWQALTNTRK